MGGPNSDARHPVTTETWPRFHIHQVPFCLCAPRAQPKEVPHPRRSWQPQAQASETG